MSTGAVMARYVPKYVSPKEVAENRARLKAWLYWTALTVPVTVALMMYGYSDQAPAMLRNAIAMVDAAFGYPVLWLLTKLAGT